MSCFLFVLVRFTLPLFELVLYLFNCIKQAEIAMKQLENLSPPIMKQVLPLVEQLPPLYTDLVKGREDFTPKPEEARRLVWFRPNAFFLTFYREKNCKTSCASLYNLETWSSVAIISFCSLFFPALTAGKVLLWCATKPPHKVQGWYNRWDSNFSSGIKFRICHKLKSWYVNPFIAGRSRSATATSMSIYPFTL